MLRRNQPNSLRLIVAGWFIAASCGVIAAQDTREPVAVAAVVEREVATGQTFVGTVMPHKTSVIGSAVDGRVIEFPVDEGQFVRKNQTLCRLRTETLEIELAAAKAELQLRQEELAELESGSRPEEIAQVKAAMLAAKATKDYSQATLERNEGLFKGGRAITERELQQARSVALRDDQAYLQAKAAHDLAVLGPRAERIAQAKARSLVQAEQVRLIEDRISKHTLIAPFDSYVIAEHTEVGAWVAQGNPVASVIKLDEVEITAFVPGEHVSQLETGTAARIEVPDLSDQVFTGSVSHVVPQADIRSRTFPVKVLVKNRIRNDVPLLKSGMLARVALPVGEKQRMALVPKDALVLGGEFPVVFVVETQSGSPQEGVAKAVRVELGAADGSLIQVKGEVKEGDRVVVRGNERLRSGRPVAIRQELPREESSSR
ncbi:MAG: efflux RND transporter periplasmic adaptor subunit [Planctomycetaceae bacterium]